MNRWNAPGLGCTLVIAVALSACRSMAGDASLAEPPREAPAFVQAACGGCHAVEATHLSPNPLAPPFAAIVNREGLTAETLSRWLSNAHNYPEEMDFDLDPAQVDLLVEHMLTLREHGYRPPPS